MVYLIIGSVIILIITVVRLLFSIYMGHRRVLRCKKSLETQEHKELNEIRKKLCEEADRASSVNRGTLWI